MKQPACSTLTLTIRKARDAQDIAAAAALYERSGTAAFTWRPSGHFKAEDFIRFAQDEEVWLAFMAEALVGVVSVFVADSFVHCLYIDTDAQRLGVGRALAARVRKVTARPLTLKLDTPNQDAIAFYEATGWKRLDGPGDFGVDAFGVSWARYRLD